MRPAPREAGGRLPGRSQAQLPASGRAASGPATPAEASAAVRATASRPGRLAPGAACRRTSGGAPGTGRQAQDPFDPGLPRAAVPRSTNYISPAGTGIRPWTAAGPRRCRGALRLGAPCCPARLLPAHRAPSHLPRTPAGRTDLPLPFAETGQGTPRRVPGEAPQTSRRGPRPVPGRAPAVAGTTGRPRPAPRFPRQMNGGRGDPVPAWRGPGDGCLPWKAAGAGLSR